jgi:hypothetical protein
MLGIRVPWDIPIEDYGFGFAMVTLTLLVWRRLLDRRAARTTAHRTAARTTDHHAAVRSTRHHAAVRGRPDVQPRSREHEEL